MAKVIPDFSFIRNLTVLPQGSEPFTTDDSLTNLIDVASKLMRAMILLLRTRGRLNNAPTDGTNPVNELRELILSNRSKPQRSTYGQIALPDFIKDKITLPDFIKDKITIIDMNHEEGSNHFTDRIELPTVPKELLVSTGSKFSSIGTIGRNHPFYHYNGSETELEFEIDWYSDEFHREDVIYNCRFLESLTMTNGYGNSHTVKLMWGQDDKLFKDTLWIVESASYKLSQFVRGYKDPKTGSYVSTSMLPQQAYQTVKLKRVTKSNALYREIMGQATGGYTSSGSRPDELSISNQNPFG